MEPRIDQFRPRELVAGAAVGAELTGGSGGVIGLDQVWAGARSLGRWRAGKPLHAN